MTFQPDEILLRRLTTCASDALPKVINALGNAYNQDQMASAHCVDQLDDQGRQFVADLFYHLWCNGKVNWDAMPDESAKG